MRGCSVEGCARPHVARGFCQNHYRVFRRHGSPIPARRKAKVFVAPGGYLFQTVGGRTRYLHIEVAERALGGPLPAGAEVHHVDGCPENNEPGNLVICPDRSYHVLLHQRQRALDACGNADWRPCRICGMHDDPATMRPHQRQFYHRECNAQQSRTRRMKTTPQQETLR